MSIYRTILEEELDIPILDDNNSPEIKEIEDIVADQDANDFEQDEAQAAEFGPSDGVDDILDETYMAIAEAETEFNKLTMAIGLHEVNESAAGREVLYEAVDIKGYIKKAKDWVVSFFKKVWQVLQRFAANLTSAFHTNSSFAKKYASQIREGAKNFKNDGKVKLKGYDYTNLDRLTAGDAWSSSKGVLGKLAGYSKKVANWKEGEIGDTSEFTNELKENTVKAYRKHLCGTACEAGEFREKLLDYVRGGEKKEMKMDADKVIEILGSGKDIKDCKDAIKKAKEDYKKTISMLNELEKSLNKNINSESNKKKNVENNKKLGAVMRLTEMFKEVLSTTQAARAVVLSSFRGRMAQARMYGQAYVAAANKGKYKGFQKESAEYGFLSNLSLV